MKSSHVTFFTIIMNNLFYDDITEKLNLKIEE